MLSIRKAIACLRQIRQGATMECGWIADGSSHWSKCAIGRCIGVQASKTGIVLTIDCGKRINWRLSAAIVRLILGSITLPIASGPLVDIRTIRTIVQDVRQGITEYRNPLFRPLPC